MKKKFRLLDSEGDEIKCKVSSSCIRINTKQFSYIELTDLNLVEMLERIEHQRLYEEVIDKLNK